MRPKPENVNVRQPPQQSIHPISSYTEPWWRSMGYNPISAPMTMSGKHAAPNPLERADGVSESSDDQSMSGDLGEEDDGVSKEPHIILSPSSAANFSQEKHNRQHAATNMPTMHNEPITQPRQLELIGHSMTCAANPYQDSCMGGIMATYGHQPLFYPPFPGMPHGRMPLPLEMAQEPVFVNAKQYQGIIRRRQARAKAEVEKKLVKDRKPYLHESRHQHAVRRPRGSGGRFAKKNKIDTLNCPAEERGTASGPLPSSHFASHLALEPRSLLLTHTNIDGNGSLHGEFSGLNLRTGACSGERPVDRDFNLANPLAERWV